MFCFFLICPSSAFLATFFNMLILRIFWVLFLASDTFLVITSFSVLYSIQYLQDSGTSYFKFFLLYHFSLTFKFLFRFYQLFFLTAINTQLSYNVLLPIPKLSVISRGTVFSILLYFKLPNNLNLNSMVC